MNPPPCPLLVGLYLGATELGRLGYSVPPTGARRAVAELYVHGWRMRRGACLDAGRLRVLADAAIRFPDGITVRPCHG